MSEPVHVQNLPIVGGNSGVSGNMIATITSLATYLDESAGYCIQATFTGSPVGSIKVQGSNDPVLLGYTDIPTSVTAISAAGNYMINVEFPYYSYVQLVYTFTSGTGTLYTTCNTKRR